jgi:undecaprenyl-diphosphatase
VVAWALIVGGIAILAIEKVAKPGPLTGVAELPAKQCIGKRAFRSTLLPEAVRPS